MTTDTRLPYPGLRAFHRDESDLFFGREGHVDKMVDRLTKTRFLAVLGPSGGGKSSLVKTGLLDALDLGYSKAGTAWCVAYMKPGGAPIRNLAAGLLDAVSIPAEPVDIDMLAALLQRGPRSIAEWAGSNLPKGYSLLILADQFEELFRYGGYASREEAEGFVKLLLEAARTKGLPLYVCITMRSEFLGACSMIPGLAEVINDGLYLTPRLSREQCKEAILGPAGVCGFDVEQDLVNKILNDMAAMAPWSDDAEDTPQRRLSQRADQLPLMQHVLNRMWLTISAADDKARPVLTRKDYDALGGLTGALDIHGEEILAQLGPNGRHTAESVFRALTTGATLETAVRRPCPFGQLVAEVHGTREEVLATVEAFRAPAANFLQPPNSIPLNDDTPIDISHESLIRQWSTLSRWFTAEAQSAATWKDLLASTERNKTGRGELLSGLDLAQASAWWAEEKPSREWAGRHGGDYDEVRDFLGRSEAERDREKVEAEERGWRERRRLKIQLAGSVAACLIVGSLTVTSFVFWQSAQGQASALQSEKRESDRLARERAGLLVAARAKSAELRRATRIAEDTSLQAVAERTRADAAATLARANADRAAQNERRATQNERRATQSAQDADRSRGMLLQQINEIGDALINSDAAYNIDGAAMRQRVAELSPQIRDHLQRRPASIRISATAMRTKVAAVLGRSLDGLRQSGSLLRDQDQLANYDRLYHIYRRAGRPVPAMHALVDGWELSERVLRERGEALSQEERALILRIGYQMSWQGESIGEDALGESALRELRRIGAAYRPDSPEVRGNARLAMALSDYENLEATVFRSRLLPPRFDEAQSHALRALAYADTARLLVTRPASEVTTGAAFGVTPAAALQQQTKLTRNVAIGLRGAEYRAGADAACALARQFHRENPDDERALGQMVDCADLEVALNPRAIANAQVSASRLLSEARNKDARNPSLLASSVVLGSSMLTIYRRTGGPCPDCATLLSESLKDMAELFGMGFVPTSAWQVTTMLDLLDRITDPAQRAEVSAQMANKLEPLMRDPHARHIYDEVLARALLASAQSFIRRGDREAAERQLLRAARLRREYPEPISLARTREIFQQCWIEGDLLALQVELRARDRALETARSIGSVCGRYLDEAAPWERGVRAIVAGAYAKLLELIPPDADETMRQAALFVAQFGPAPNASQFIFRYLVDRPGSLGPQLDSVTFRETRSTLRSAVADFETGNRTFGARIGPASATEFLRRAEASAQRQGRSFPVVAQKAWEEAVEAVEAAMPKGETLNLDQLTPALIDRLYQRAITALDALDAERPLTSTSPTAR